MLERLGILWGILFLLGGILGFVPGITEDDMFLGIFMVNTAHGIMHIASGAIFLIASMSGARAARLWFLIFGMVYAAVAVMGFMVGDGMICGLISNNRYDSWGHAVLALVLLLIGFTVSGRQKPTTDVRVQSR
jgi:hypothetical protein